MTKTNISKFSIHEIQDIVSTSAIMALEAYSDLREKETGEQMSVEDKCNIIRCNERSWLARVMEQIHTERANGKQK